MAGNPGKMNRRLTIQARALSKDAMGGRSQSWSDLLTVWAELLTHRSAESVLSDAERETDMKAFRVRYHPAFTTEGHRVLYKLEFYNIEGIEEEGVKDRLILKCRSIKSLTA